MKFQAFVLPILFALCCTSYHIPNCKIVETQYKRNNMTHSVTSGDCVAVVPQDTHLTHRTSVKRSRIGEVSFSPEPVSNPYTNPENSTTSNTTLPIQQQSLNGPSWMLRFEGIVTPVFRTVILLLTLFNINITWRIHGQWKAFVPYKLSRLQLKTSQRYMSHAVL